MSVLTQRAQRTRELEALFAERIVVLDGATGTRLQVEQLDEAAFRGERFLEHPRPLLNLNDILVLSRPELIRQVHKEYLEAGADIIETNTFNANSISLVDYGVQDLVYELNREAAGLARTAVGDFEAAHPGSRRFVAGSIGPTSRTLSMSQDVKDPAARTTTFAELRATYAEQVRGLLDGGVDLLLPETVFDTLNLKACLFAIEEVFRARGERVPVIPSVTFIQEGSDRTLSGQTLGAFLASIAHVDVLAVSINCALGPEHMRPHVQELAERSGRWTGCYPNAGLPNEFGGFDLGPDDMARALEGFAREGWLNLVGGCCGTTPAHIAAISEAVRGLPRRERSEVTPLTTLSGLDEYVLRPDSNFTLIGERTNVAGSKRFLRLVKQGKFEEAAEVARGQVEGGANVIDVCMDEALLDGVEAMTHFLNQIAAEPDIARVPVMVDSSDFAVLEAGLRCVQGKGIANSLSLKDGEEPFLERARTVRRYGAAVVVMAFDEQGQATGVARRLQICERAYRLLTEEVGFPPEDIIFDVNVYPVATGIPADDRNSLDFIEALAEIKRRWPQVKCSGGLSNVSFSYRGNDVVREAMHAVFLYHAIQAGLDMAIVNAGQLAVYDEIDPALREAVEDVILARSPQATERLTELAEAYLGKSTERKEDLSWREAPLAERLGHALLNGVVAYIDEDVAEALATYPTPLAIIEGPLMDGMSVVGDLFGSGKMFLPQVVKSARVMQKAVALLEPHMERKAGSTRGRVLLATVKGDVHDIGKNIVGVVLGCNGFDVVDMGVMVPCEQILARAREEGVDVVGLSGLITPSLHEMVHVAKEMRRGGFTCPLLIGGATTSRRHTAVKIAPEYDGTLHVLDASRAVEVMGALMDPKGRAKLLAETLAEQAQARADFEQGPRTPLHPLAEARARRLQLEWRPEDLARPAALGVQALAPSVAELVPYIDWTPFFATWELKGTWPKILDKPEVGPRARELKQDADALLARFAEEGVFQPRAVYGLFRAWSEGDDVVLAHPDGELRLPMLRQQTSRGDRPSLCLADYLAPRERAELQDHAGAFVVTAGPGSVAAAARLRADHDEYQAIMVQALADRLAEAAAEWLHERVRAAWGYEAAGTYAPQELIRERYRGIRPAPGYPACPDHLLKPRLFELLGAQQAVGVRLTESLAMDPPASVSGLYFAHPEARYFAVGKLGQDQLEDYAGRLGITLEEAERWLAPYLV
ncbi:MAG: methionine synthase [Planctomycetota bacterium]